MSTIRHDWYQTEDKVVVTVMLKNPERQNCKVTIEPDRLLLEADDYKLELNLLETINTEKSFYKFGSVKVEITLVKFIGRRWAVLTKETAETKPTTVSIYQKDWDAMAKIVEQEKDAVSYRFLFAG